jgi:hypothetical protein
MLHPLNFWNYEIVKKKSQLKYLVACDDHISCEINILHGIAFVSDLS